MASVDFFGTFPALHPGWLMLIYIVAPWIPIVLGVKWVAKETHWRGGRVYSFCCNLVLFLYRYAPMMVVALLFLSSIMLINQASYAYRNLSLNRNPGYFLSVDQSSFNILSAINSVTVANSYNQITLLSQGIGGRRRLQASMPVDTTLTLTYHTGDFSNVVTSDLMQQICETEVAILRDNTTCINKNRYDSVIPQLYKTQSCVPLKVPLSSQFPLLGLTRNSRFVQDSVDVGNPASSVLITYFDIGTCSETYDPKEFSDYLQKYVSGSEVHVTFTSEPLNRQDVDDVIDDAGYYLMVSAIVCTIILILFQRGLVMALVTMFCFFFSLINAASFTALLSYSYFSILNAGSFLILMIYGSSITLLWSSAWRRQVKPASHPTVANILNAYVTVGQTLLYITLLGLICCFVLLISPVVIVSQFGVFTGFCIACFYVIFHYVFVPTWIFTSWFIVPKKHHRRFRRFRSLLCPCYDAVGNFFKDKKGWTTAAIIAEFVEDDADDDVFDEDDATVVDGVVHADEVQIVDPSTQAIDPSQVEGVLGVDEEAVDDQEAMEEGEEIYDDEDYDDNNEDDYEEGEGEGESEGVSQMGSISRSMSRSRSRGRLRSARSSNLAPAATSSSNAQLVAAPLNESSNEVELAEVELDTNFCRGKRPLKFFGLLTIVLVLIAILIVYIISVQKFRLNLGLPRIIHDTSSNLAYQFEIIENYKYDLLTSHMSEVVQPTTPSPTRNPTRAPLSLRPTARPSVSPTLQPTTGTPAPTKAPTAAAYIDYTVTGCWGVSYSKDDSDADVIGEYDSTSFQKYANNGLVNDMLSVCQYVSTNRDKLDVHPTWTSSDCIYSQYQTALQSLPSTSRTVNNGLLAWTKTDYTSGALLGVVSNSTSMLPVWLCANFTLRSYIKSAPSDPQYVIDMESTWKDVFSTYSIYAKSLGVPVHVSSPLFTYPVLSHRQQVPLYVTIAAVVAGFSGLLWLFTLSDYGLTIFGALSIFTIIIIVLCIHLFVMSAQLDLFDFLVVTCLVLLIADLPVQLIEEYIHARALLDKQQAIQADKALSPALAVSNKNFRSSILFPTILVIFVSIAPLYAEFQILRRIASYVIIIAIVSLVFTVCIEPYMLAFGCRTKHFEALCYVEEEDEGVNGGSVGVARSNSVLMGSRDEVSPQSNENSPQQTTEVEDDRRSRSTAASRASRASRGQYSAVSSTLSPSRSGRMTRQQSTGSASSSVNSRGYNSLDSRQSAGVISRAGSVSSGIQLQPLNSMYHRPPPGAGASSYYPPGVAIPAADGDYGYPRGAMPMTNPPPPVPMGGSMYYPQHPNAVPRYGNAPPPNMPMTDPRLLMYQQQQQSMYMRQTPPPHPHHPLHPQYRAMSQNFTYHPGHPANAASMYGGMNPPYPPYPGPTPNNNNGSQYPMYPSPNPNARPYSAGSHGHSNISVTDDRSAGRRGGDSMYINPASVEVPTATAIATTDDHHAFEM